MELRFVGYLEVEWILWAFSWSQVVETFILKQCFCSVSLVYKCWSFENVPEVGGG